MPSWLAAAPDVAELIPLVAVPDPGRALVVDPDVPVVVLVALLVPDGDVGLVCANTVSGSAKATAAAKVWVRMCFFIPKDFAVRASSAHQGARRSWRRGQDHHAERPVLRVFMVSLHRKRS